MGVPSDILIGFRDFPKNLYWGLKPPGEIVGIKLRDFGIWKLEPDFYGDLYLNFSDFRQFHWFLDIPNSESSKK